MPDQRPCPECGRPLPADAREEVCAVCALQGLLTFVTTGSKEKPLESERSRPSTTGPQPSTHFGDYELLELLARGGMGVVYKARQISLDRTVALKMIQAGLLASAAEVKRFQAEAEAIARLQHPNIVAVHEIGEYNGQHFFSMDFVAGRTLAEIVRDGPMPATRAAAYVKTIAAAVHYAHQHGILHRDLKPANIIIDENDQPRVTDFGLAKKLTDSQFSTLNPQLTLSGQVLGSPNYLPPEQAEPKRGALGPPSDVYALGAILYHLVTGRPPFQAESLTTLLRQVIETDPVAPRSMNPGIPRDLETICLKCLEKQPPRRYRTAQELADELQRFLNWQPVLARPVGVPGKTWRWCQRQPVKAGLMAALILVFVAGAAGIAWQWRQAQINAAAEATQRQAAVAARVDAEIRQYTASINLAQSLVQAEQYGLARDSLLRSPESYRGWEWGWLLRNCSQDLMTFSGNPSLGVVAYFSPDSHSLVTSGFSDKVCIWDLASGKPLRTLPGPGALATPTAFSPDGKRLCTYHWGYGDNTAHVWDLEQNRRIFDLRHPVTVTFAALSPDGHLLASGCTDGKVRVFDVTTGADTGLVNDYGDGVLAVVFSPDGRRLAYAGGSYSWTRSLDTSVRIWDLTTGETKRLKGHSQAIYGLAWSPKNDLLVSCSLDGQIKAWDPDSGRELPPFVGSPKQQIMCRADFSPDGRLLGVVGADMPYPTARATLFEVATRRVFRELAGHSTVVQSIRFSPDGQTVATSSLDGTVKIWSVAPLPPAYVSLVAHRQPVWSAAFSPDGRRLATGSLDQTARIWDSANGALLRTLAVGFPVLSLAFSPDGSRLVTVGPSNTASIWNLETVDSASGREQGVNEMPIDPLHLLGHKRAVVAVAWSPDGHLIATGSKDNTATIWNAPTREQRLTLCGHSNVIQVVAFSPGGNMLATGSADGTARLWSALSGECLRVLTNHPDGVLSLAFSPKGRLLATGAGDGTARMWDSDTGRLIHVLSVHVNGVSSVAFSPDGQRLVTTPGGMNLHANVNRECRIVFWDVASGHQLLMLPAHDNAIYASGFSPDGRRMVTVSADNTARVWTAFPWRPADYPDATTVPFAARLEDFKRRYWQSAIAAQLKADALPRPWTNGFRTYSHSLGYMNLPPPGSKTRPLFPIPARAIQASPKHIDLGNLYNVALTEPWQTLGNVADVDRSLAALPAGLHHFDGPSFDIRGIIQLSGAAPDSWLYPGRVEIPVRQMFTRLHVVHGATWGEPRGRVIGAFILHYKDGNTAEVPILFGENLRGEDVRLDPGTECSHGRAVWTSKDPIEQTADHPRIYQAAFTNPNPAVPVERIEFTSSQTKCAPFLLALTVE